MSSHEEIMAVYSDDIAKKSYIVECRLGKKPFYDNFRDMYEFDMFDYAPSGVKQTGKG